MRRTALALIAFVLTFPAVAQDTPGRQHEPNVPHELARHERALQRIQAQMNEQRTENKAARRIVADAEPAAR